MNWGDERYVRLYTRDTPGWIAMPWEARALLPLLLRKVDRAGVLDIGDEDAAAILAAVVMMPVEIVRVGLDALVRRGTVALVDGRLIVPNYLEAQEARASDKARAREHREQRRARALSHDVTGASRNVTVESRSVTERHAGSSSRDETSLHAVPYRTEPCRAGGAGGGDGERLAEPSPEPLPQPLVAADAAPDTGGASKAKTKATRGTRLPAGWTPSSSTLAWAKREGIVDPLGPIDEFRDYWRSVAGAKGTKLDWDAVYRNRLRELVDRGRLLLGDPELTAPPVRQYEAPVTGEAAKALAAELSAGIAEVVRSQTPLFLRDEDEGPAVPMPPKVAAAMTAMLERTDPKRKGAGNAA